VLNTVWMEALAMPSGRRFADQCKPGRL